MSQRARDAERAAWAAPCSETGSNRVDDDTELQLPGRLDTLRVVGLA